MNIKGLLRPTNRGKRLLVGLLLAGLFCIQCTVDSQANRPSALVTPTVKDGRIEDFGSPDLKDQVEAMAKADHVQLLKFCLDNYERKHLDYTCTFIKQETIRGCLAKDQEMSVRFMDKPFSVVMTWTKNRPSLADRVIYVEGKYNGMVLARPVGVLKGLGTQMREPWGDDARKHSLKPITEFGLAKATRNLIDVYETARRRGECTEEFAGYRDLDGRTCLLLIRYLKQNDEQQYPAKKTETYVDAQYLVPVCIKGWDWNDNFSCQYYYKDIRFNVNLTEKDFLPQSNDMKPPK